MSKVQDKAIYFLALAISIGFFIANWDITGPVYQADEGGYLANAAALAGYWPDAASSYHAGYSLLLVPAFWISDHPQTVFALVKLLNAILWGVTTLVLHASLKIFFPDINRWKLLGATIVAMIYPAWVTLSGYSFSESGFVLFYLLTIYFALRVINNGRYFWLLWALSLGYLYAIHPKALPVLASAFVAAVLIAKVKREWFLMLGFVIITLGMVYIYDIAFKPWLIAGMTTGDFQPDLHYPQLKSYLAVFGSFNSIIEMMVRLSGQFMYIGLATLGIVFFPIIVGMKSGFKKLKARGLGFLFLNNNPVFIFIFLSFIGTHFLSAWMFTALNTNGFHHWMYGRYVEGVVLPFIVIGLLLIDRKRILCSVLVVAALAIIIMLFLPSKVDHFNYINGLGLWQPHFMSYIQGNNPAWLVLLTWVVAGLLISMSLLLPKQYMVRLLLICIVFLFVAQSQVEFHEKQTLTYVEPRIQLSEFVRSKYPLGSCVALHQDGWKINDSPNVYAFYFLGYNYKRLNLSNWFEECDGPLLSSMVNIDSNISGARAITYNEFDGLIVWSRDSNSYENNSYMFIDVKQGSLPTRLTLTDGWHQLNSNYAWSEKNASLALRIPPECYYNNIFGVRLSFQTFNASLSSPKTVLVELDGTQVAEWVIYSGKAANRVVPLPNHMLNSEDGIVHLTIRVPEATSPALISSSSDTRILGIGLREIEFLQGSDFREAFLRYSYQPPQGLNWEAENKNIPTQVGKKVSSALLSTDQSGFLVYGPYVPMKAGSYMLEIRGIMHSNDGRVITDVVSNKGNRTLARFGELDAGSQSVSKVLLNREVVLDEAVSDLEVRVWVDELADIELHDYLLRPINDTVKPLD